MLTSDTPATPTTDRWLTPQTLVRDFGARAAVARDAVCVLHDALKLTAPTTLARWRSHFGQWAGRALEKTPRHLARLAQRYRIAENADTLLFALQTYYAMLVDQVACRVLGQTGGDLLPGNPFSWYSASPSKGVQRLMDRVTDILAGCRIEYKQDFIGCAGDLSSDNVAYLCKFVHQILLGMQSAGRVENEEVGFS